MEQRDVLIYDTTLRDGEQSPGVNFKPEQKLLIARALEELGVDIIEVGFPASSNSDFLGAENISKHIKKTKLSSFCRLLKNDIDLGYEAVKNSYILPRIHVFIATSDLHIKYKLNKTREQILELIREGVGYARSKCEDIQWCAEDASRTDLDFLVQCIKVAINAGARTVMLPDTVGYATPQEYGEMFSYILKEVKEVRDEGVILSSHCHNDLGLATANSLSAVSSGASQVEVTINGLGERAGNCALEEFIIASQVRKQIYNINHRINTKNIISASRLVETLSSIAVQKNKAIVGANAFAHEAGIHQDGLLKNRQTYEIISPEDIGLNRAEMPLGKHSGRAALKQKLLSMGIDDLDKIEFDILFAKVKELAQHKREIHELDLLAFLGNISEPDEFKVVGYKISGDSNALSHMVEMDVIVNGEKQVLKGESYSPLMAVVKALETSLMYEQKMEDFEVQSLSTDKDSQTRALFRVRLPAEGIVVTATGLHQDTMMSTAIAYANIVKLAKQAVKDKKKSNVSKGI